MCNPDKFVIWKIDAGKLIQKYEPFVLDGKLVHKSLSTVSSEQTLYYSVRAEYVSGYISHLKFL